MTIGEKIKSLRLLNNMTQSVLGEITGIGEATIRKYELGIRVPKAAQIERIASALNTSSLAITGINNINLRFETTGDLMGIIILLCSLNVISITGERGEDKLLKPNTVSIKLNPVLSNYLNLRSGDNEYSSLESLELGIKSPIISDKILMWEKMSFLYNRSVELAKKQNDENILAAVNHIAAMKEQVELELQRSPVILDETDKIRVKLPPEF